MNNEDSIKELDEYARLHNISFILRKVGELRGFRKFDYNIRRE